MIICRHIYDPLERHANSLCHLQHIHKHVSRTHRAETHLSLFLSFSLKQAIVLCKENTRTHARTHIHNIHDSASAVFPCAICGPGSNHDNFLLQCTSVHGIPVPAAQCPDIQKGGSSPANAGQTARWIPSATQSSYQRHEEGLSTINLSSFFKHIFLHDAGQDNLCSQ
jgi:hypothetical protein